MDITTHRYLVINNDIFTTNLIIRMLHENGARNIDSTDKTESVLRQIQSPKKRPDIIICALALPKLDGVEFLRHLAKEKFTGGLVLISSQSPRILRMAGDLAEAHRLNLLGCLAKPFPSSALFNLIARFEGLKKALPLFLPTSLVTPEALDSAIKGDQMVPFFQGQIAIKTGKLAGMEVLARWQHPELGIILPALFIPVAEEHGLVSLLTQKILSKTFQYAATWKEAGLNLPFAVNLSARLLSDVNLPDHIEEELRQAHIDPSSLTLEITESALCLNMSLSMEVLLRLRLKEIRLSIDDFGTGNSNLEQLHKMPFSELKIDRQFVTGAAFNDEARMFFQSAVMLAKELKLTTIAEGVETQSDWDICRELECDVVQGYFISRPVSGEAFFNSIPRVA